MAGEFTSNIRDVMPGGGFGPDDKVSIRELEAKCAGDVYFFSHDVMLCYCALITGADPEIIVHTLQSALTHIEQFAPNTPYHARLRTLFDNAKKRNEADWTEKRRRQDAHVIWVVSRTLGSKIEERSQQIRTQTGPTSMPGPAQVPNKL